MPLIERKVLARGEASVDSTTYGVFFDGALVNACVPQIIELNLGANVIRESVQITSNVISVGGGIQIGFAFARPTEGPRVLRGSLFCKFSLINHTIVGLNDENVQSKINDPNFKFAGKGQINLGEGFFQDPETGSISLIISVFRPHTHVLFSSAGQIIHVFFPYRVEVEATGFEATEFSQDSGISEELISACITDKQSIELYGERPSVTEIQSDFIETQNQAIRVGEAFLWNRNQVLGLRLVTLFNPSIKRGVTIQVTNAAGEITFLGIVKSVGHSFSITQGSVITEVLARTTEYIFQSFLGETNVDEKLDERQSA